MEENKSKLNIITVIIPIILIIISAALIILLFLSTKEYKETYSENYNTIQTLQTQLPSDSQKSETEIVQSADVKDTVKSMTDLGNDVIKWQSKFRKLVDSSSNNENEINKVTSTLSSFFTDDVSMTSYWYVAMPEAKPTWEFKPNYGFNSDKIPVLWTCKNKDGYLLACIKGTYNTKINKFSDIQIQITSDGQKFAMGG